jgi:hypothetical protein
MGDQRDAITMALMGIANPAPQKQLPQYPQQPGFGPGMAPPRNLSQGMTSMGNAIGGMGQPAPGAPTSLAPPPPAQPMPAMGTPVGSAPQMPPPQLPGPQGVY